MSPLLSENMKELILETDPSYVSNVTKTLVPLVRLKYMKELTWEKNPMCANSVGKPSFSPLPFIGMEEHTAK